MSSSRIIKGVIGSVPFMDFHFQQLQADGMAAPAGKAGDNVFTPITPGNWGAGKQETASVEVIVNEPENESLAVGIAEEEVARRVQAAYNDGLREGRRQSEESLAKVSEALAKALLSTGGLRQKVMQESEEDLLQLAINIARKIILQEISIDRRILMNIIKAAVSNVSEGDEIVVRLNPADYELVADNRDFMPTANEKRRMTLKADENIPGGGCLVDTSLGAIDARIDAQLDEIFRRFMEDRNFSAVTLEKEGIEEPIIVNVED